MYKINKDLPLIKKHYDDKYKIDLNNNNNNINHLFNALTPKNETQTSFIFNNSYLSTSYPEKKNSFINSVRKNKDLLENEIYNKNPSSLSLPLSIKNKKIQNDKKELDNKNNDINALYKSNMKYNQNIYNTLLKYSSLINKDKKGIIDDINLSKNPKNYNPNSIKIENKKSKMEEKNNIKNYLLQKLYKNIKLKTFNENKKDISNYLQTYKGTDIKEPNYRNGSHIYNSINDFMNKSLTYNLSDEINKIRNKTNIFDYKKSTKLEEITNLNNRIKNLIYDCAEDILDLNNDIKI